MNNLVEFFRRGTSLMQLIYINVAVFVIVKLLSLLLVLFNIGGDVLSSWLVLPSNMHALLYRPWTALTYMFYHIRFSHLFFNMIALYWFGRIALEYFSQRQLVVLYLMGGVAGALLYVAAYNVFPYFANVVGTSSLLGASGAVLAICTAAAAVNPSYPVRILFIGEIKLVWLAALMVLVSLLGITGSNAGGEFAHIGGALAGYFYGLHWRRCVDLGTPLSRFFDWIKKLFRPKPKIKVTKGSRTTYTQARPKTDAEYNRERRDNSAAIDAILDKIKQRGYESLTSEEKRELFDRSKGNY